MSENNSKNDANRIARELLDRIKSDQENKRNELLGMYVFSKVLDVVSVILLIGCMVVVVKLYESSLFEGFISTVVSFFFIKYIFKNRNEDWFSWFHLWF